MLRGEADVDDCFQPGYFEVQVPANAEKEFAVTCAVSHESQEANVISDAVGGTTSSIKDAYHQELSQRNNLLANFYRDHPDVPNDRLAKLDITRC